MSDLETKPNRKQEKLTSKTILDIFFYSVFTTKKNTRIDVFYNYTQRVKHIKKVCYIGMPTEIKIEVPKAY